MDETTEVERTKATRPSRVWWVAAGALVLVGSAVAVGVFGVHTLFIDETVDEAAPAFRSGATESAPTTVDADAAEPAPTPQQRADASTTTTAPNGSGDPAQPVVREVGRGSFAAGDHPGAGGAVVLTDGAQTFVRFEDDFATDNGPDLYAVVHVDGERVELGTLKGNRGSQNYEVPSSVDPEAIESVAVWCKRFDSTFTTATIS